MNPTAFDMQWRTNYCGLKTFYMYNWQRLFISDVYILCSMSVHFRNQIVSFSERLVYISPMACHQPFEHSEWNCDPSFANLFMGANGSHEFNLIALRHSHQRNSNPCDSPEGNLIVARLCGIFFFILEPFIILLKM